MTELYIDGVQVVLPENFTTTVKRENVLFTKNGEYTYEISLYLDNPVNAELYSHLNRYNGTNEIKTKRSAVLIADNRVYCNGTEIVTGWDQEKVKIQVASGSSELNYFVSSDALLESLDMGEAKIDDPKKYIEKYYPDIDFCLCPVGNTSSKKLLNNWKISISQASRPDAGTVANVRGLHLDTSTLYAQPYLCFYLNELLKSLGYEVEENVLIGSEWEKLFLVQSGHPTKFAKMFPGVTAATFLHEMESLFNVSFVINDKKKKARILFNNTFFIAQEEISLQQVKDEYSAEVSDEDTSYTRSNISYDIPDNDFYQGYKLSEEIIKAATLMEMDTDSDLREYLYYRTYTEVKDILFFVKSEKRYYIAKNSTQPTAEEYCEVNHFGDIRIEGVESEIKIGMIPAEMGQFSLEADYYVVGGTTLYYSLHEMTKQYLPCIESDPVIEDPNKGIYDRLINSENASTNSDSSLCIAFYQGMTDLAVWVNKTNGAPGHVHEPDNPILTKYPEPFILKESNSKIQGGNLRLLHMYEMLYSGSYDIDVTKAITVETYDPNVYDARLIFNIRNKRYVCKDMEFTLDRFGRKGAWKGTYYPIRLSDVEAQKRWILTDGKWRDGGVWLDNGRWLDE